MKPEETAITIGSAGRCGRGDRLLDGKKPMPPRRNTLAGRNDLKGVGSPNGVTEAYFPAGKAY